MPLSFHSKNHGNIAFGFFNIESDMLLLENHFFFASDFCSWLIEMSQGKNNSGYFKFPVYKIKNSNDIGDLMGAIHGVCFTGFIGETYKMFPFPSDQKLFKQNPKGFETRKAIESLIHGVAEKTKLIFDFTKLGQVNIGPYVFDHNVFWEMIQYVWEGGYPRWKDQTRPAYVLKMKTMLEKSKQVSFDGVFSTS
ncbi:MAG: hypothetical protein L3J69_19755 [Desulfobacula sp.]|nr:hypothetical protein [Desulfobacula sp.]